MGARSDPIDLLFFQSAFTWHEISQRVQDWRELFMQPGRLLVRTCICIIKELF